MDLAEARCAESTMEDVFTPDGDAVTVDRLLPTGAAWFAVVGGAHVAPDTAIPIAMLRHNVNGSCPRAK